MADAIGMDVRADRAAAGEGAERIRHPRVRGESRAFALALRDPAAAIAPDGFRGSAIRAFLDPMFDTPAATLAYATKRGNPDAEQCGGLVRA